MKKPATMTLLVIGIAVLILAACVPLSAGQTPMWKPPQRQTALPGKVILPVDPPMALQAGGNADRAQALTPTKTPKPSPTATPHPTITATVAYLWNPAGKVVAPILLYHHVTDDLDNLYTIHLADFRQQMEYLKDQGYQTIPISLLIQGINKGAELPSKAVVITFDDGYETTYTNAFPIMKEYGYTGVIYLIGKLLDSGYPYLTKDEITEMRDAGWEYGSHSMSHVYLTDYKQLWYEISSTRKLLSKYTGTDVMSFAYPYGLWDKIDQRATRETFSAGLGLGKTSVHTPDMLYYLSRLEIRSTTSFEDFQNLLTTSTEGQ